MIFIFWERNEKERSRYILNYKNLKKKNILKLRKMKFR